MIPKKIYQSWKTKDLPEKMQKIVNETKRMNPEYEKHAIKIKEMVDMLCNKIENLEVCLEPQVVADFIELVASDNLGISSLASVEKLFEKLKNLSKEKIEFLPFKMLFKNI